MLLVAFPAFVSAQEAEQSRGMDYLRETFDPRGRISGWSGDDDPDADIDSRLWGFDQYTPYVQRFGVAERIGDGLGYQDSYTTFEFFTPLRGDGRGEMLFGDMRMIARNDGTLGANVGGIYRVYNETFNRIFGVNAYYDHRVDDLTHIFQQAGLGVESLGPFVDLRANVYIPDVGATRGGVPNRFVGNILIVNRDIVAMPGVDCEIGGRLPALFGVQGSVYGGFYHFDGRGTRNATGWKARAQVEWTENVYVDAQYQDDDLFGQTFSVGIALRYRHRWLPPTVQAERPMDHMFWRRPGQTDPRDIAYRLSEPVERLQNIVLTSEPQIARDSTGAPLNFLHVVPGAAGVGTFEDPYGTLGAALADAAAGNSVIYTPQGGAFTENVTLVTGAQVLSNGPIQRVSTTLGRQRLPFSGRSVDLTNLPTLVGNVDMADDSRFSGFDVTGQVTATGVMNWRIDNSVIENPAGDAIVLTGVNSGTLDNVIVSSGAGRGVFLDDSSATLRNVDVRNAANDGVEITSTAASRTVDIVNLKVNASALGLDINVTGAGDLTVNMSGEKNGLNMITSTSNGIDAATAGGSTGNLVLSIEDTTVASTAGAGFNVNGTAGAGTIFVTRFADNTVTRAATGAALFNTVTFDADPTTAAIEQVNGGTLQIGASNNINLVGDGLRLLDPTGDLRFAVLNIFNRNGTGLLVDTKGGGTTFNLETGDGAIVTNNGAAMNLDPLTVNLRLGFLQSTNSTTNGVLLDTVSGNIRIDTSVFTNSTLASIMIENTPAPLKVHFGDTAITSTISTVFADNVDTSVNNMGNVTVTFGDLTITGP